jgi:hypothetical protein
MSQHRNATHRLSFVFTLVSFALLAVLSASVCHAIEPPSGTPPWSDDAAKAPPDVIVFTNGDQLSGTFVREVDGTVTFHSDIVGDINIGMDKVKELHTKTKVAVLNKSITSQKKINPANVPQGTVTVADQKVNLQPENNVPAAAIPVKDAPYIIDQNTFNKEVVGRPGFFAAWNGTATAGATIVQSTQKQYTYSGAVALARVVPTVSWLNPRNRTTIDFSGSYGKITQHAFISGGVFYPATSTKTSLYHADAERDEYFSPRMYVLGMAAFDHNYSLLLDLQQIYGGGLGWTALRTPKQELDLKGTVQYEKQSFINAAPGVNQDLIGSTFAAIYMLKLPREMVFNQEVAYIPAWNNTRAYSVTEANTLAVPAYKNLAFSIGTLDTYLNNPPPAIPSTKRNSFQFTFGATYVIKSKY